MPTKIYGIKMNDFWINVRYSPPHYARQKTKKSNKLKMRKMSSNHNKSNFKDHTNCGFSPRTATQASDISIAGSVVIVHNTIPLLNLNE